MANSRFRVDNFRSYRGSQDRKAASQHHSNPSPTSRYPTPPSITEPLSSFSLPPSPPHTRPSTEHISPVQTHPRALIHPLPARPPAEVCAHARTPRSPLSLSPNRDLESHKELPGQPAGSSVVTASDPAPVTPGLQEAQAHQSSVNSDHHTDPSTSWHEMFDVGDIIIDEITPQPEIEWGLDSSSIPYSAQLDAAIPIDPAILGDTISAPTYDWQGGGGDSDFTPSEDLLQERSSPQGNRRAFEPEPEPRNQAVMLGAIPSHELLDSTRHPSHGSHITGTEAAVISDVFRAAGNTSEDMTSDKRRSSPEHGSDRPFKRVRTGATPSEDTHPPLLPTLCSQFLETPLNDRLEFLSWLFEGALARCTPAPAPAALLDGARSKEPEHGQVQNPPRRKKPWEPEEIKLLTQLKKTEKRSWPEVFEIFRGRFPARKEASIRVYWSKLKDK